MWSRWKHIAAPILMTFCVTITLAQSRIETKSFESLKNMFGDSIMIAMKTIVLSAEEKQSILQQTKTRWRNDTIPVLVCTMYDTILGYGFVDDVKGKMNFITYIVGVTPNGAAQDVDVIVYRESYGGEIAYESFRKQFRQKSAVDKLQPGRDIKNISGATISVGAITSGVKRILLTFELIKSRLE